jgi:hypothetical protein
MQVHAKCAKEDAKSRWLGEDIRHMAVLKFKSAVDKIIVSRNNDAAAIFECTGTGSNPLPVA